MADRRPFHESIVGAIMNAATIDQMRLLDNLINQTKIPKGHDEIARVWREKMQLWSTLEESLANGVPDCLENQKREAEAERRAAFQEHTEFVEALGQIGTPPQKP